MCIIDITGQIEFKKKGTENFSASKFQKYIDIND